ncbi:MAG: bifunctional hydroxymethylpyrimidine kinase/phosphomethylpyrimidine kinase [bacterium]|nr:bifunctional hydroxymethylpyrimidine kinase/phosphomethylpyrimidine kinase [bacterium]
MKKRPVVLTVAGSDSGGGAGIQADLKTFYAFGVYGASVITGLTAQNTVGVRSVFKIPPEFVIEQLEAVFDDFDVGAVKTGMLCDARTVETVSEFFVGRNVKNIIVDPVMISKSGHALLEENAVRALVKRLLPLAAVITPNIFEAEKITGIKISSVEDMRLAAGKIVELGAKNVFIKGGHLKGEPSDVLCSKNRYVVIKGKRQSSLFTHGTGCAVSSAIASCVAKGYNIRMAVRTAKQFVEEGIKKGYNPGKGCGPVNHFVRPRFPENRDKTT